MPGVADTTGSQVRSALPGVDVLRAKLATHIELALRMIDVVEVAPAQLPDQPANVEPAAGTALSVTVVFCVKLNAHTLPQEMPAGVDVTVPEPVPVRLTVRLNCGVGVAVKVAVQVLFALSTIELLTAVPVQLPDQPAKLEPADAVAVRVTVVFCA